MNKQVKRLRRICRRHSMFDLMFAQACKIY